MKYHTVSSYDKELEKQRSSISSLAKLFAKMLKIQEEAFETNDKSLSGQADKLDQEINLFDKNIEDYAVVLIATRQPLANDLRFTLASIRVAVIIERMGDIVKNVIRRASTLKTSLIKNYSFSLVQMNQLLLKMLEMVIESFATNDEEIAVKVVSKDELMDSYYSDIIQALQSNLPNSKDEMYDISQIVIIAKNMERIGDYLSKFAQIIYSLQTGKKIKNNK